MSGSDETSFEFEKDYKYYVIIVIGLRYNIKFFSIYQEKNDAEKIFTDIFNDKEMCECDSRGYFVINGKTIYSGFNNQYGIITVVGFDDINSKINIGFRGKPGDIHRIVISNEEIDDCKKVLSYAIGETTHKL